MRKLNLPERRSLPSRWAVLVLLACIIASLFIALGARAQTKPSKPEESATIQDDETLVPDPKESADNNLTFPTDI